MTILDDTLVTTVKGFLTEEPVIQVENPEDIFTNGCGCSGNCGQSCAGDCESGCSGDCGRSCSGSGS